MYILSSTVIISFVGIAGLFFYRLWEIKKGKIVVPEYIEYTDGASEKIYNFCDKCTKKTFLFLKHYSPWYKDKIIIATNTIINGSGALLFKNLINGKKNIGNEKKSASIYLKDITEHKNNITKKSDM